MQEPEAQLAPWQGKSLHTCLRRLPGLFELALQLHWKPASHVAGSPCSMWSPCQDPPTLYSALKALVCLLHPQGRRPLHPSGNCVKLSTTLAM